MNAPSRDSQHRRINRNLLWALIWFGSYLGVYGITFKGRHQLQDIDSSWRSGGGPPGSLHTHCHIRTTAFVYHIRNSNLLSPVIGLIHSLKLEIIDF